MKKYLFLGTFILAFPCWMKAQGTDYAGPDGAACQGGGAVIGNSNPGNVCYTWDAADGLNPNDIHSFNPTVRPKFTTTYTVHVTGNNFGFSATDQVEVVVDFGGLQINPSYIKLGGPLENQATAEVTVNDLPNGGGTIIYSIPDPGSTGCDIYPTTGVIHGCMQDGEVLVRATSTNYPDCYTQETLHINGGIKDLIASDNSNDGRMASNGGTLYIIGPVAGASTGTVNFKAVKNENASFPSGQPVWSGSFTPPENLPTWDTPPINIGSYSETAGSEDPKTVNISCIGANEFSVGININTGLIQTFIDKIKGNTKVKAQDPFCSTPFAFTLPPSLNASYKEVNVPKYHDPDYDIKKDISIDIPGISVTGCVYFPCCTGFVAFGPVYFNYFTYLGSTVGFTLNAAASKDPSASANPEWTLSSLTPSFSGKMEAGLRLEAGYSDNAGVIGNANLSTEAKLEGRYMPSPARLEWNISYGGLVGKVGASVWYVMMDNAIEIAFQKSLIPGSETGFQLLYDMSGQ